MKKGTNVIVSNHFYNKEFANKKGTVIATYHDNCILSQTTWIHVEFENKKRCVIPECFVIDF